MNAELNRPIRATICTGDISDRFLALAMNQELVAFDLETTGLDWSAGRICLCQVALPDGTCGIVRIGATPQRLVQLLTSPHATKVFHHAMFDLRFMAHHWKVLPTNVACTKIAAKLLHPDRPKNSLKDLLAEYLGVVIDKTEQRSDWSQPELTHDQLAYAVKDVVHLLPLFARLVREIHHTELMDLYQRCLRHLPTRVELELRRLGDVFAY